MDGLWQDLKHGARILLNNPGFAAVATLTLTFGIGANTAIFSVVHAVLLEPLPYAEPDRLLMIWNRYGESVTSNSPPDYFDRVEQSEMLESIAAFQITSFNLTAHGEPVRLGGARVTASFFEVLGVAALHGSVFLEEEDSPERGDVVVLSHGSWVRRFGEDLGAVGSKIRLNDRTFIISGVMPPSFSLLFPEVEVWAPMAFPPAARGHGNRGNEYLSVLGRMKPGVSLEQVRQEMQAIAARVLDTVPARRSFLVNAKWSAAVVPLREQYAGDVRPAVLVLFASVLLVLLIACANVAGLLLARGADRVRELSVRAALGAGRPRLVRQLLVENLTLSMTGGALGLLLAWAGVRILSNIGSGFSPLLGLARLNMPVLAFALSLMLLAGLLFGLAPAVRLSRIQQQEALRGGPVTPLSARHLSGKLLVMFEVCLALVLLVGAGLLVRSFHRLTDVKPGYETTNRLTFRIALPEARYAEDSRRIAFHEEALERLRHLPGVIAAGAIHSLPIGGTVDTGTIHVEGYELPPGAPSLSCEYRMITPEYLRAMGIPLLRGRDFRESDTAETAAVVLVDERAASRFWPGEDPIGKRLGFSVGRWREVVGVVGTVRNRRLDFPGQEQVYIPYRQLPQLGYFIVLHSGGAPTNLAAAARDVIRQVDSNLPIFDVRTMEDRLDASLGQRRLSTALASTFAAVALALASIGIYGVIAGSVRRRTREIGIRVALGAQRAQILRLVVGQGMAPALGGMALGIIGAAASTRLLEELLFDVTPHDPLTLAAVSLLLAGVGLLACWLPAWRAANLDPVAALRQD